MYFNTGKHSIKKVESFGEYIILDDNSRWKISLMDKTKSMMWTIIDDVTVASSFGNIFKITHIKRNETVEATFQQG